MHITITSTGLHFEIGARGREVQLFHIYFNIYSKAVGYLTGKK